MGALTYPQAYSMDVCRQLFRVQSGVKQVPSQPTDSNGAETMGALFLNEDSVTLDEDR